MPRYGWLIDVTKCSGCYNCFLACRDEYYGNDYGSYSAPQPLNGQHWMQVKEIERGTYPKPKLDYIPVPCMHCQDPPCMVPAQDGAVYRREDGIVLIDPVKAKGQKDIVGACPYRVIFWNDELQIPQKCTMCAHRLDEGDKEPRCVEACPTGALVFGDLDDPESDIVAALAAVRAEDYHPEYETSPTVKYVGIPKRFIVGEVVRADVRGECVQGAVVTVEGEGGAQETRTDIFGDFEFEGLEKNSTYTVRVELAGYATHVMEVVTRRDVDLGEIVLEPQG
ncbi:MAG: 4Fe-4S dicluster domain-containing protein [Thermoleophilia bacterium]|jgi:Fe-S-cluster-containing dehydrogenase component